MAYYENAIAAKARAMYGRMLSPAQYKELAHKQSVQELAAYLKNNTAYAETLAGLQESTAHRGLLESLLRRDVFYQYMRLVKYAGAKTGMYHFVITELEVDLIVAFLRESASPSGIDPISIVPSVLQPHASFDIFALAKAKGLDEIFVVLENTPYAAVLQECRDTHTTDGEAFPFAAYEMALRRYYLQAMLDIVKASMHGKAARQMTELIVMRAEIMNINTLYRIKASFSLDRTHIRQRLLPFYDKISPRMMTQMIEADSLQAYEQLLRKTAYASAVDGEKRMIEMSTAQIRHRYERRLMQFATDPQVVYVAFMLLRAIELENLTRIIEGVRYKLSPDRIEALLSR